jgi:thiol:disulfide interchange protein DsbD
MILLFLRRWVFLLSFSLQAAEGENPLRVEMKLDVKTIVPGQTFQAGFLLRHPEGYHSYWKHPGIVGLATSVKWELPDGFVAGEIRWPAPQKVAMGPYPAQGYHDETLLMIPITAPAVLPAGDYELKAKLTWMCCSKTCHPGLAVPFSHSVHAGQSTAIDDIMQPIFAKYLAMVPAKDDAWETSFEVEKDKILLHVNPAKGNTRSARDLGELWFFTADGTVDSAKPQRVVFDESGNAVLEMERSEFAPATILRLPGVLYAPRAWSEGRKHIEIDALPRK